MTESRSRRGPVQPVAYTLHTIKLREGVSDDDFERFMLEQVFPAVDTSEQDEQPDQHFLLGSEMFGDDYVWMSRLEYWIHHDPLPNWLGQRVERQVQEVKENMEPFGTITSSTTHYDVTGWRARLKR
jgi:hypothetical protein